MAEAYLSLPDEMFAMICDKMDYKTIKSLAHTNIDFARRVRQLCRTHALSIAPPVKNWMYYRSKYGNDVRQLSRALRRDGVDIVQYITLFGVGNCAVPKYIDEAGNDFLLIIFWCNESRKGRRPPKIMPADVRKSAYDSLHKSLPRDKVALLDAGIKLGFVKIPMYDKYESDGYDSDLTPYN